ncbi:hypothetical protein FRX31_027884, partial [Thalictrum thalictroides]
MIRVFAIKLNNVGIGPAPRFPRSRFNKIPKPQNQKDQRRSAEGGDVSKTPKPKSWRLFKVHNYIFSILASTLG